MRPAPPIPLILRSAAAALAVAALAACNEARSQMQVPEPPPALSLPVEYAFGDTIAAADAAAIGHVVDRLKPRYGQPKVTRYTAPSSTDFAQLKAYYDMRAAAAGWEAIPDIGRGLPAGERTIAYRAGDSAFALIWLAPRADSPITPVSVILFSK